MSQHAVALWVATMDTKGQEAMYLVDCLKAEGIAVKIIDLSYRINPAVSFGFNSSKI